MEKIPKVSFCITCKGRIEHIKQTLRQNIDDNQGADVQFVLLDYNSTDGLQEYIKENFADEIADGTLKYVYYPEAEKFKRGHAKNMAHRAADGEILVDLDGDNFTGEGFADYVAKQFDEANEGIFLRPLPETLAELSNKGTVGCAGRIAVKREDFFAIGGYDEKYKGWSAEDANLDKRLQDCGLIKQDIDIEYLNDIPHSNEMRAAGENVITMYAKGFLEDKNPIPPALQPNKNGFGCGEVYINFSEERTIFEPLEQVEIPRTRAIFKSAGGVMRR
jgi:glycosyltransferase involved in cell wall biosynthesis